MRPVETLAKCVVRARTRDVRARAPPDLFPTAPTFGHRRPRSMTVRAGDLVATWWCTSEATAARRRPEWTSVASSPYSYTTRDGVEQQLLSEPTTSSHRGAETNRTASFAAKGLTPRIIVTPQDPSQR